VMTDRETGRSRGFGFVEMSSPEAAEQAIGALNGSSLDGRMIRSTGDPRGSAPPRSGAPERRPGPRAEALLPDGAHRPRGAPDREGPAIGLAASDHVPAARPAPGGGPATRGPRTRETSGGARGAGGTARDRGGGPRARAGAAVACARAVPPPAAEGDRERRSLGDDYRAF
jgi:hypothetical protein